LKGVSIPTIQLKETEELREKLPGGAISKDTVVSYAEIFSTKTSKGGVAHY